MYRFRAMFLVLCLCLLSVVAFADSVTGQFTIDQNLNTVPSQGSVTFTLQGDGTIFASLTVTNGANILGFGFNSATFNLPESNFSRSSPTIRSAGQMSSAPNLLDFSAALAGQPKPGPSTGITPRFSMFWTAPRGNP